MLRYLHKKIKGKTPAMSEEPLAPDPGPLSTNEQTQTDTLASNSPPPDQMALFMEAYDCAKNNHNWSIVSSAISTHPGWLTRIPQGRRWTILHQIVYSGNVIHLNEVLAYQISNTEFRLLFKASDDTTVREVAMERSHVHAQMLRRVELLVATDQLLNNAKDNKWDLVRQFLRQQPDYVNEKPPFRKYYLAHYLALIGRLDIFRELTTVCEFKLDLLADNKTISQIARENNHIEFAEFVEHLLATTIPTETTETNDQDTATNNSSLPYPTSQSIFSQGFYDDPGMVIVSLNPTTTGAMFLSHNETLSSNDIHYATHSFYQGQNPTTVSLTSNDSHQSTSSAVEQKEPSKSNVLSTMTDEDQVAYEKIIETNANKLPTESLLNAITCSITKNILEDPVVAADGFTYERKAILNWFEHSNRSPMTNKELTSLELKPNHAIKSILKALTEPTKDDKETDKKSKLNGHLDKQ